MSNESNRDETQTVNPADLKASDFFPPGAGWNKDEEEAKAKADRKSPGECLDDGHAVDGTPPY